MSVEGHVVVRACRGLGSISTHSAAPRHETHAHLRPAKTPPPSFAPAPPHRLWPQPHTSSPRERVWVVCDRRAAVDDKKLEVGLLERPESAQQRRAALDLLDGRGGDAVGIGG